MRTVLVTGSAGFIGFHLSTLLLQEGFRVVGFDAMTDYYDRRAKAAAAFDAATAIPISPRMKTASRTWSGCQAACAEAEPDVIVHLAAQAGVRYSLENPRAYVDSNLIGTFNVLECARELGVGAPVDGLDLVGLRRQRR